MRFNRCICVLGVVPSAFSFFPSSIGTTHQRESVLSSKFGVGFHHTLPLQALPSQTPSIAEEGLEGAIQFLDTINQKLSETFQATLNQGLDAATQSANEMQQLAAKLAQLPQGLDPVLQNQLEHVSNKVTEALQTLLIQYPALRPSYESMSQTMHRLPETFLPGLESAPPTIRLLISSVFTYAMVSSILSIGQAPPPSSPYPLKRYDAAAARVYFDRQFPMVLRRGLEIATSSIGFGLKLLMDYVNNDLPNNAEVRAVELARLLTRLGPSFIKIGQSLSIRTDLLSPAYVRGLTTLQDQVPPFDTAIARQLMQEQWGVRSIDSVLSEITPEPVAAASLGQVYKARLQETGQQVAIKVLRPEIETQIALDMHILRELAPIVKSLFNLNTDIVGVVDTWGAGFVDELDYVAEARNAQEFMRGIQKTELKDVVFAPPIVENLSTTKVLTTEWVDGERLDRSDQDDVTVVCSIAMNTYLTMMLELGTLHSDPHPGNLLLTPDGRLCILDWGMVTSLDNDLQLTLITHMAHLTSRDYPEIPRDLLLLGFIPEDKADLIEDSGIVEVLADIYGAWTDGGGAAAINVNKVVAQLQDLTAEKGNLFQIPPYFAYIAKCFSVLEGIGLSNDPKYSIISECLPYVSKRLLTDQNMRTGAALSTFIFGPEKHNIDTRLVDYKRVEQLLEGFASYTTSSSGALVGKQSLSRTQILEAYAEQVLDLVFAEEATPLQTIVIEQVAKIIGAGTRSFWTEVLGASGSLPTGRTVLGTLIDPLGIWRTSPLVRMDKMDSETIVNTQKLINLMQSQIQQSDNPALDLSTVTREEAIELATVIGRKVWERRSGVLKTGNRLTTQLLKITAKKLELGDRESILLREPQKVERKTEDADVVKKQPPEDTSTSRRLLTARQRLSDLERDTLVTEPMGEPAVMRTNL